jgi:hypothetical protein
MGMPLREEKASNKSLITSNESSAAEARSVISGPAETAATIAIAPATAEGAGMGTAGEAAAAEIDFGQFGSVLSTQIIQHRIDALMVALNRCAWTV